MDGSASPNIHTIVKAQIVFLLSTLTEENFERNQVEIRSVSNMFGCSGEELSSSMFCRHDLRVCSYLSNMELTRTSTSFAVSSFTPKADSHPPHPPLRSTLPLPSPSAYSFKKPNASHAIHSSQIGSEMVSIGETGTPFATSILSNSRTESGSVR